MDLEPAPGERTRGHEGAVLGPGPVDGGLDEPPADAPVLELGRDPGVHQDEGAVVQAVDELGLGAAVAEDEPTLVDSVLHRRLAHDIGAY
jgi:hypothetical protein